MTGIWQRLTVVFSLALIGSMKVHGKPVGLRGVDGRKLGTTQCGLITCSSDEICYDYPPIVTCVASNCVKPGESCDGSSTCCAGYCDMSDPKFTGWNYVGECVTTNSPTTRPTKSPTSSPTTFPTASPTPFPTVNAEGTNLGSSLTFSDSGATVVSYGQYFYYNITSTSNDGGYWYIQAKLQSDNNFVVYLHDSASSSEVAPMWSTGVQSCTNDGKAVLEFQGDGNLAIKCSDGSTPWKSGTGSGTVKGPFEFTMDESYLSLLDSSGKTYWQADLIPK